jgi:hypothetical protein
MSALVVGALLRVLDSPLREMSEGIAVRLRRYWKKE